MSDINIVLENRDDIHVAVEEKDINVEVPAGKDGRSLRPRGEWSAAAAYAYLDLVSYQGSSYVATKAVPAGTLPTNTSYWMLSAEKGEPGGAVWGNISGDLSDQTDLQEALDDKAPVIISSASGSIASFTDGSASPVTALTVSIEPVQSGTGDPSPTNVRPISGHTSAVVTRTGKNLFDKNAVDIGFIEGKSGNVITNQSFRHSDYIRLLSGATYTITNTAFIGANGGAFYDIYKNYVGEFRANTYPYTFVTPSNVCYIRVSLSPDYIDSIQLELGSTASAYEPYQGQQVTIDLDGTRYGGSLNFLTGEMTVTNGFAEFDGSNDETWNIEGGKYFICNNIIPYNTWAGSIINPGSSNFAISSIGHVSYGALQNHTGFGVAFAYGVRTNVPECDVQNGATVSDLRTYLSTNPFQVCIQLKTPFTVQLTPSQISTLLGQNNLWADTGDVAVEYRADTKLFVQGQIAQTAKVTRQMIADSATADGKAPKSLATGDLIIVGDELRKATANIGNGSAITASNSTIATLADVIKALQ